MPNPVIVDADYILERVTITETGCWEWLRSRDRNGYGMVSKVTTGFGLAHRLSYKIFRCDPGTQNLRHTCDNPPCCNPNHLVPGTQGDNLEDMRNKGRGWYPPRVKRSPEMIAQVLSLIEQGVKQCEIARLLNMADSNVTWIKQHHTPQP